MKTILAPALDIAPLVRDAPPFNNLANIAAQAANFGYTAVLLPSWDGRVLDVARAASDAAYRDEILAAVAQHGLKIAGLSVTAQSRVMATHPGLARLPSPHTPVDLDSDAKRHAWAVEQLRAAATACAGLGVGTVVAHSGALLAPFAWPGAPVPPGLLETAWEEIGHRFRPVLDAFDAAGVDVCFAPASGGDVHDGISFEAMFAATGRHRRCFLAMDPAHLWVEQIDPIAFLDYYHSRIRAFLVSDAEVAPNGRQSLLGPVGPGVKRPAGARAPGDGQIDLAGLLGRLSLHDFPGWAIVSPVCALRHPLDVAATSAPLVSSLMLRPHEPAPAPGPVDAALNRALLGLR